MGRQLSARSEAYLAGGGSGGYGAYAQQNPYQGSYSGYPASAGAQQQPRQRRYGQTRQSQYDREGFQGTGWKDLQKRQGPWEAMRSGPSAWQALQKGGFDAWRNYVDLGDLLGGQAFSHGGGMPTRGSGGGNFGGYAPYARQSAGNMFGGYAPYARQSTGNPFVQEQPFEYESLYHQAIPGMSYRSGPVTEEARDLMDKQAWEYEPLYRG